MGGRKGRSPVSDRFPREFWPVGGVEEERVASQFVSKQEFEKAIRKLKGDILTLKQTGGGSGGSTAPASGVPVTRIINTTSPLAGGGDLAADLTLSLAGLDALGTGDFFVGVNAAGDAWEYKQLLGTANRVTVAHAAGSVTLSGPQDIHEEAVPTFQGLILGPEGSEADTWLLGYSYFDFGTTDAYENLAGAISFSGEGQEASGSTDVPGTRGTEWNLDTAEFVSSAAFAGEAARRNGCLSAGLLILHNETTGKFDGYSTTTGLLVRSTTAHNFSTVEGLCADGTYFYATGTKVAPGYERVVYKYLISDFSFIDSWEPAWPTYQGPFGIKYNGGYLFVYDARTEKIFKLAVSDMSLSATLSVPTYDGSHVYSILDFDLDSAGAYIYAIAEAGTGEVKCRKFSASDCSHVADGTDTFGTSAQRIYHYAEGAEERFYVVYNDGSNQATKINPATLDKYYAAVNTLAYTPLGIAADGNYLYVFYETQGIDRHLKNDIGGTASTEAGRIRIWINALGSLTQAGLIDSGFNLSMFGYVEGTQLKSTVATGTPPLAVASETMVANLNADLLDGYEAAAFALAGHSHFLGDLEDVLISSGEPTDGDVLAWSDATSAWVPTTPAGGYLVSLLDVSVPSGHPESGDVPAWDPVAGAFVLSAPGVGALALDDLSDVDAAAPDSGDLLTFDGAKWVPAAPAVGGLDSFVDNFADSSIFAGWVTYGTGASKTITESAGGTLDFSGSAGQDCSAGVPRIFLPVPYWPCEIETKLSAYNKGERTKAGMFIGPDGGAWSGAGNIYLEQIFSTADGINSVYVEDASSTLATAANSTVPKWFKIRCMGSHKYAKWYFYYSTDGAAWTLLYTYSVAAARGGLCAGLFIGNWYNQPAVTASFEYFTIVPYSFTGPG